MIMYVKQRYTKYFIFFYIFRYDIHDIQYFRYNFHALGMVMGTFFTIKNVMIRVE